MMAFRAFLITMIVILIVTPALATNYRVGDEAGWTLDVNYTKWTQGKDFLVGDKLFFEYIPGVHNVLKVNGTDFQQCSSSNLTNTPLTSGNDTITLATPGRKWYICSIGDHCSKGMKLVIIVSSREAPGPDPMPGSPTPTPRPPASSPGSSAPTPSTSPAGEISMFKSCIWMLTMLALYRMIML